jgi:putative hydrolases of HD superfamily
MTNGSDDPGRAVARFLHEAGVLKRVRRSGWLLAGVREPESVAEHSWRTALIAFVLATLEGADPFRTATLAVWHDTGESRSGDLPSVGRAYVQAAPEVQIAADQVEGFPPELGEAIRSLIAEYEERDTPEARLARDADKLECLLTAREYQAQGIADAEAWVVDSAQAVHSESARRLANAALAIEPKDWWRPFVEGYNSRRTLVRSPDISPAEERAARRREWARQSQAAPPPGPPSPGTDAKPDRRASR